MVRIASWPYFILVISSCRSVISSFVLALKPSSMQTKNKYSFNSTGHMMCSLEVYFCHSNAGTSNVFEFRWGPLALEKEYFFGRKSRMGSSGLQVSVSVLPLTCYTPVIDIIPVVR